MIDEETTLRAEEAVGTISTSFDGSDMWSTRILLLELGKERINLKQAIEKDSYNGVRLSENRVVDICEGIKKLRKYSAT